MGMCNCWTTGPECCLHRTARINPSFNWVDYKLLIERDVALRGIKFGTSDVRPIAMTDEIYRTTLNYKLEHPDRYRVTVTDLSGEAEAMRADNV